jgi:hypothetical protein
MMKSSFDLGYERKGLVVAFCYYLLDCLPMGGFRKLMLFQVKSMSNLQKERLNYGRKLDTPLIIF